MNIHKNGKLTPVSRAQLVKRVLEEGEKDSYVAEGMGISPPTFTSRSGAFSGRESKG